jgi:hypothetical protein
MQCRLCHHFRENSTPLGSRSLSTPNADVVTAPSNLCTNKTEVQTPTKREFLIWHYVKMRFLIWPRKVFSSLFDTSSKICSLYDTTVHSVSIFRLNTDWACQLFVWVTKLPLLYTWVSYVRTRLTTNFILGLGASPPTSWHVRPIQQSRIQKTRLEDFCRMT